jgi:MOSC domain-containing protein YiiM
MIGDLILEVTGETKPCFRMEEASPGLRNALNSGWRGGVTCRVLQGGQIRVGDRASLLPMEAS